MASNLRESRQRRNPVTATKKTTHAVELIVASRTVKAQQAIRAIMLYADTLVHAVSALTTYSHVLERPLLRDAKPPRRSVMLVITGDRGLAGIYSANMIRVAEQLWVKLLEEGQKRLVYVTGNKGAPYYDLWHCPAEQSWTGFFIASQYAHVKEIPGVLIERLLLPYEEGSVGQSHVVATRSIMMFTQGAVTLRLPPLAVEGSDESASEGDVMLPHYVSEPTPEVVLDQVSSMYVTNQIRLTLLQSGVSELTSKQHAMKLMADNAQQLIERLTREVSQARQVGITQEISEVASGVAASVELAGNE